jgi:hypothetical protein
VFEGICELSGDEGRSKQIVLSRRKLLEGYFYETTDKSSDDERAV